MRVSWLGLSSWEPRSSSFWVFCVDIFDNITVNVGSQHTFSPALVYSTNQVTTNSSGGSGTGNSLSKTVSGEIQYLANLGFALASTTATAAVQDSLTAIQAAIWNIEYGLGSDGLGTAKLGSGDTLAAGQTYTTENALIVVLRRTSLRPCDSGLCQWHLLAWVSSVRHRSSGGVNMGYVGWLASRV